MSKYERGERWPEPTWAELPEAEVFRYIPEELASKFDVEIDVVSRPQLKWLIKRSDGESGYALYRYCGMKAVGMIEMGPVNGNANQWEAVGFAIYENGDFEHVLQLGPEELNELG